MSAILAPNDGATFPARIPAMTAAAVEKVREFEQIVASCEQVPFVTHHLFHAGIYARTITVAAGVVLAAALIKRPTVFILSGDATVATGEEGIRLTGYHVIPASAHRKTAVLAHADTQITMKLRQVFRPVAYLVTSARA